MANTTIPNEEVITVSSLTPQPNSNFTPTPELTPVSVPPLPTPEPTPQPLSELERRMQVEADSALAYQDGLSGKTSFALEQQKLAGVPEQQKLIRELNAQLVSAHNEANAIPLRAQEQSVGRGITKGGLAPIEAGAQRQNAIKILETNSVISAAQGNLQNAMDMADRAVAAKYGPIEEKLQISLANLELISKNPQYTADQRARAEKQAMAKQAELDATIAQKENAKAVNDELIRAVSYNPGIDQMSIKALSAAKSPAEFAMIANYLGLETMSPQDKADLAYKNAQTAALGMKTYGGGGTSGGTSLGTSGGSYVDASGTVVNESPVTSAAKDWIAQFNSGLMSIEDIYSKIGSAKESLPLRSEVARLIAQQKGKRIYGADDASIQAIQSQITNIDDLLESGKYGKIVGLTQGGAGVFPDRWNVGKQDVLAIAQNLTSNQTLQALADAKSKGITFGALSERELGVVAESASRIAAKLQTKKDKAGNITVTGFSGSEGEFEKDLRTIKRALEKSIASKTQATQTPTTAPDGTQVIIVD